MKSQKPNNSKQKKSKAQVSASANFALADQNAAGPVASNVKVMGQDMLLEMRRSAGQAASFLRTMANKDRLLLLCQITQGEACVNSLEGLVAIRQPTLSQQLGVLRRNGMVNTRRESKNIFYSFKDGPAMHILAVLYQQFCSKNALPDAKTTVSNKTSQQVQKKSITLRPTQIADTKTKQKK